MGSQQSSRRITVISDEASGVIKISDSVVNRLKEEIEGANNNNQQKQERNDPPSNDSPSPQSIPEDPPSKVEASTNANAQPHVQAPPQVVPEVEKSQMVVSESEGSWI